jgi:hypothetical protein
MAGANVLAGFIDAPVDSLNGGTTKFEKEANETGGHKSNVQINDVTLMIKFGKSEKIRLFGLSF